MCKTAGLHQSLGGELIYAEVLGLFFFRVAHFSNSPLHLLCPRSTALFMELLDDRSVKGDIKGITAA